MTFARRIVNSAGWSAAETLGGHVAMLAVFIALARHLDPEAFGLAALAVVVPVILSAPVTTGLPEALTQRREIEPLHLDSAFWVLVGAGAMLSGTTWIAAALIASAFGLPLLEEMIRWTCLIVTIKAISAVPIAILKRELRFRTFAIRMLVGSIAGGTVGITMAVSGFGVWSLIAMLIAQAATETIVTILGSRWRPRMRYSHAHCRQLLGFAAPVVVNSLLTFWNFQFPKIVLSAFLGPHAVGIYVLAYRPFDFLTAVFVGPIISVTLPAVSRMQVDLAKVNHFFNASTRITAIAGFAVFVGFAAVAPIAVPLIFGDQWSDAVVAAQILMLLGLVRTLDALCSRSIMALGHPMLVLRMKIAYTVIAAALLPIGALFGLEAAMIALVACNALLAPVFIYFAGTLGRIDVMKPLGIYPRLAVASGLMFASVYAWQTYAAPELPQIAVLVVSVAIGAIVYCSVVIGLARPDIIEARRAIASLNG